MIVIVASVVLGILIRTTDKTTTPASAPTSTTSTTVPALPSVADQPCVALADRSRRRASNRTSTSARGPTTW